MKIIQFIKNKWYKDAEMVKYWKTKAAVEAKVTTIDGSYVMVMEGEKYPFPGFPRGPILFTTVSKLKHEIKNQIFNDAWAKLEDEEPDFMVRYEIRVALWRIFELFDTMRLNMLPIDRCAPVVKELHRAWSKVENGFTERGLAISRNLKDVMCFILQEDDSYRFRVQWCMKFLPAWWKPRDPAAYFEKALNLLEHAEVVGDMKERIRLLRRILLLILKDPAWRNAFNALFSEVDVKKMRLSKGDKYYFRGKYFKCDYPAFQY